MAKKTDTNPKPAAPSKAATKPVAKAKTVAEKPAVVASVAKPAVATPAVAKPTVPKPAAAKAKAPAKSTKSAAPKKPAYTLADVELRAYFIAEKRRSEGLPGDEHQDWIEAERQLAAETGRKKTQKA
jgi:hypothetical protein